MNPQNSCSFYLNNPEKKENYAKEKKSLQGSNNSNNRVSNDEAKRQKDCKKEKRKNKDRIGDN